MSRSSGAAPSEPDDAAGIVWGVSNVLLPRSVRLALWLSTDASAERIATAVQGSDEPHRLLTRDGTWDLASLIAEMQSSIVTVAALLPVPGDAAAVPRTQDQYHAGTPDPVTTGECLLIGGRERHLLAVPDVQQFGSAWDFGHVVTWHLAQVDEWETAFFGSVGSLAEAESQLRTGLTHATATIMDLELGVWRPEVKDGIAQLRDAQLTDEDLPTIAPRRLAVLSLAVRLKAIAELALEDASGGGAVNVWQADQSRAALLEVLRVTRRAIAAASYARIER